MKISKTVYSICYPETEHAFEVFKSQNLNHFFTETYTKKQDSLHLKFFETWKQTNNHLLRLSHFPYFYPTAGSSEAIREQLVILRHHRLVVFHGEYEGYEAIAKVLDMQVLKIDRDNWRQELQQCNSQDVFFISPPSAIDGDSFIDFDELMNNLNFLKVSTYVDLCYLGLVPGIIDLTHKNIDGIFFSLSKIFGVYYHRTGGVMLKKENPLLYGNMWFKNIFAIKFGEYLMQNINLQNMVDKYKPIQAQAVSELNNKHDLSLTVSPVLLLATAIQDHSPWQKEFIRNPNSKILRLCLTPTMEPLIRAFKNI